MKIRELLGVFCLAVSVCPAIVIANTKNEKSVSPWGGSKASLGLNLTRGDNSTDNIDAELDLNYKKGVWSVTTVSGYQRANAGAVANKNQVNFVDQLSYSFNQDDNIDNYTYVQSSLQSNQFAAYDSQWLLTVGYGRDWVKSKTFEFSTQLGPGYRLIHEKDKPGGKQGVAGNASAIFKWPTFVGGVLEQDLTLTQGNAKTTVKSVSSFTTKLKQNLALNVSATVTFMPVDGTESDSNFSMTTNLVYNLA